MKRVSKTFLSILILAVLAISINIPSSITIFHKKLNLPTFNLILSPFGIQRDFSFRKGLELQGGTSITLKADMSAISESQRDNALTSARSVIERRVNFLGVSEPTIQTAKVGSDYRILVELPGVSNVSEAEQIVGKTAKLDFRSFKEATPSSSTTLEDTLPTGLTGADLENAQVSFGQSNGAPVVLFNVTNTSQDKFFKVTESLIGKPMAIFLDDQFIEGPIVRAAIRDSGIIEGNFSLDQAKSLAIQLNAGALPVPLSPLEKFSIGPTLGLESLAKSLFAGVLGFVIIVVFMVILYGRLGVIASFALVLYVLFVLAIFKLIPVTLTLAGIAGFVLSIGMAVDANILIFERMKEELRRGKPREIALELGFSRAWSSIRDSNVSSIITAIILFQFGTGIVRGFALTLLIGVLISMFSAIVVTRTFLRTIYK